VAYSRDMTAPSSRDPQSRFHVVLAGLAAVCLIATGACSERSPKTATPADLQADTLYLGSHILTLDEALGEVDAVAVRGEEIVWVGQQTDWRGRAETVVELGERALLPGFIDAHGHLTFLARTIRMANVASPPVGPVTDLASLQDVLRAHIAEHAIPAGEWVLGMGYDDSLIAAGSTSRVISRRPARWRWSARASPPPRPIRRAE